MDEKMLAMADRLAFRSYAYRIFHIAFGAKPTSEILAALRSEETLKSLEATVHHGEGGGGLVWALEDLLSRLSEDSCLDLLGVEFDRLFNVPGSGYVYPWASAYELGNNMIFRESTLEVRRKYAARGFQAKAKGHFPEDHVAMMLDFLGYLSLEAFDAFCAEDDEAVRLILEDQAKFLDEHFGGWFPEFVEKVEACDRTGFYAAAARDLRTFEEGDRAFLADMLA